MAEGSGLLSRRPLTGSEGSNPSGSANSKQGCFATFFFAGSEANVRIVSKYHDYYDSVMAHGQDQTTVYVRTPKEVDNEDLLIRLRARDEFLNFQTPYELNYQRPDNLIQMLWFRPFYLVVAGKRYRGLVCFISEPWHKPSMLASFKVDDFCYSFEHLTQYLLKYRFTPRALFTFRKWVKNIEVDKLKTFLSHQGTDELASEMAKHRVVIASEHCDNQNGSYWMLNESLQHFKFYRVMDSFTLYQELDMYISGVLGQQAKEIITISDKDRIPQHGFDKYSFRKLPEVKR